MYAENIFKTVALGFESVPGTPVPAPKLLYGTATLPNTGREIDVPKTGLPYRAGHSAFARVLKVEENGIALEGSLGIENALRLLALATGGIPTATDNGDGTYTFVFDFDYDGTNQDILTATLEAGTNAVTYQLPYALLTGLTFKGAAPSAEATFTADFVAQKRTPVTPTAYETPTLHAINGKLSKLTFDGSELEHALVDWNVAFATGVHPKRTGGDSLYYEAAGTGPVEILLSVSLERVDALAAIEAGYNADTPSIHPVVLQVRTPSGFYIETSLPHAALIEYQPFGGDNDGNATDMLKWSATIGSNGLCKVTVRAPTDAI